MDFKSHKHTQCVNSSHSLFINLFLVFVFIVLTHSSLFYAPKQRRVVCGISLQHGIYGETHFSTATLDILNNLNLHKSDIV